MFACKTHTTALAVTTNQTEVEARRALVLPRNEYYQGEDYDGEAQAVSEVIST